MVILPSDHRLAALKAISPKDLVGETFVTVSNTAPVLRVVIDNYLKRSGIDITPDSRGGPPRHGNVLDSVDARRRAVACLRTELSAFVCNESSSQRRHADDRAGPRLQKVERVSHPKAFAFEIGRVGGSCLEEGPLKLGMHLSKRDYGVLESGAILILTAVGLDELPRNALTITVVLLARCRLLATNTHCGTRIPSGSADNPGVRSPGPTSLAANP